MSIRFECKEKKSETARFYILSYNLCIFYETHRREFISPPSWTATINERPFLCVARRDAARNNFQGLPFGIIYTIDVAPDSIGIMPVQRRGSTSSGSLIKRVVYSFWRSKHVPSRREMIETQKCSGKCETRGKGRDTLRVSEEPTSEWRKCCIFTLALQAHTWTQE